ncbi:MAG: alpha/beta fold hydrolase [Acidimicrobiales bacterium]
MPTAAVNGAEIAYDDTGGTGPPIVLAHGFLMDRSMFEPQVAALRGQYRVITWDERGFGDTVYDGGPFTYWDSAADCVGLMDHLGIDVAVVGGMSQGGFLSLRVALMAPERVRALILLSSQAGTEDAEVVPLYQAMIDQWVAEGPSDELAATVASIILSEPSLAETWTARWKARDAASLAQPGATLLTRDSVEDRLGELSHPALVVHGSADAAISLDKAERVAAGLSGCDGLVLIDGGTHAANLTHPEETNAAILAFLDGLPTD